MNQPQMATPMTCLLHWNAQTTTYLKTKCFLPIHLISLNVNWSAIARNGTAKKLVFVETGKPPEIYEMADPDAWYEAKGGLVGAKRGGQLFTREDGLKMRTADVTDKQEAGG